MIILLFIIIFLIIYMQSNFSLYINKFKPFFYLTNMLDISRFYL